MQIQLTPVWSYLIASSKNEEEWLGRLLQINRYVYPQGYSTKYLYYKRSQKFLSGLLPLVLKKAKAKNIKIAVQDIRPTVPTIALPEYLADTLYTYQQQAIDAAIARRYGILKLPTAAGKTHIAVGLAERIRGKTLMICHEVNLVTQARKRYLELTQKEAGTIEKGNFLEPKFVIDTIQTLRGSLENKDRDVVNYVKSVDCLIMDECHVAGAKTFYKTLISLPNTALRIGLSATPVGRSDGLDALVIGVFGPIIYEVSHQELLEQGRIAKSLTIFYDYPQKDICDLPGRDWHKIYSKCIVNNTARNNAIIRLCKIADTPILVFYERKLHGYKLLNMLKDINFSVKVVHGNVDGEARAALAQELNERKIDVLLCSKVFNAGTDIPNIRTVINAAGYKAEIPTVQKHGRGKRVGDEKKDGFVYLDLMDRCHPSTERHSLARYRALKSYGEITIRNTIKGIKDDIDGWG